MVRVQREMFVEKLLMDDTPNDLIIAAAEQQFGIGMRATQYLIQTVKKRWEQETADRRQYWKDMAIRRLMHTIKGAREDRKWGDVVAAERLLSQIQGTQAPVEIKAEFTYAQAVADYISNYTDDELNDMIAQYNDMKRRASVITVQAEQVSPPLLPKL
jgi:hypothetical protein